MVLAFGDVAFRQMAVAGGRGVGTGNNPQTRIPVRDITSTLHRLTGESSGPQRAARACETFVPQVTQWEAQAIAEELKQRGDGEFQRVMDRSRLHSCACPMLTQTGMCACSIARPLACIGRCVVGGDSPEWVAGLGDSVSEAFRHHLENQHVAAESGRLDDVLVSLIDRPRNNPV